MSTKYNIVELAKLDEFDVAEAIKNFDYQQDYFNKLTDFAQTQANYLKSYNPSVIIYGEDVRREFYSELEKIKDTLKALGMNRAISELKNLDDAIDKKNPGILSDRLLKFHADMEIIAKHIISARIPDSDSLLFAELAAQVSKNR